MRAPCSPTHLLIPQEKIRSTASRTTTRRRVRPRARPSFRPRSAFECVQPYFPWKNVAWTPNDPSSLAGKGRRLTAPLKKLFYCTSGSVTAPDRLRLVTLVALPGAAT